MDKILENGISFFEEKKKKFKYLGCVVVNLFHIFFKKEEKEIARKSSAISQCHY